ncbi:DNA-3-methyladenine glycosylase [Candidatus Kaiserbacteria bacterium]|nr:DNA-3-methyladenine glycosylase [Candidatus Kaiserbacteria bacterium]
MARVLRRNFFERRPQTVARELLGKFLVRRVGGKTRAYVITETEAYDGTHDLACHASKGRTRRTEVMFGPAGYWYVYFVYGMYDMLNIVTGLKGYPSAVLIRACQGKTLTLDGPGKLTRELGITHMMNGKPAVKSSGLWVEDRGVEIKLGDIKRTPRIGVAYAGSYADKLWRFVLHKRRN